MFSAITNIHLLQILDLLLQSRQYVLYRLKVGAGEKLVCGTNLDVFSEADFQ